MKKSLALMAAMAAFFITSQTFVTAQEAPMGEEKKAEGEAKDSTDDSTAATAKEIDTFLKTRATSRADHQARLKKMEEYIKDHADTDFGEMGYVYTAMLIMTQKPLKALEYHVAFTKEHGKAGDPMYGRLLGRVYSSGLSASVKEKKWDLADVCIEKMPARSSVVTGLKALKGIGGDKAAALQTKLMNVLLYSEDIKDEDRLGLLERVNAPTWERGTSVPEGATLNIKNAKTLDGDTVSLSDYKGKVLLVDFWATWCGPCIREMPNVVKTHNEYKDKGFEILAISFDNKKEVEGVDTTIEKVKKRMTELEMDWPSTYDGKGWSTVLGVRNGISSIPAAFLFDHTGKLRYKSLRGAELGKRVGELIKEMEEANKEE